MPTKSSWTVCHFLKKLLTIFREILKGRNLKNDNLKNKVMSQQENYIPTSPIEPPSEHPGRTSGIIGIVCAVISILFFPIIFGPVGIVLGVKARQKGSKNLGLVAIILSAVFMVGGMLLGILVGLSMATQLQGLLGVFLFH